MNSKVISLAKNKLKEFLRDKEILDVVLFGSSVKGKEVPEDIDVALITDKEINKKIEGFHISVIKPREFFTKPPMLINTILREGYSLRENISFAEKYRFSNKAMFVYELKDLNPSEKVKIVNVLRGINGKPGLVKEYSGEWLANQVIIISVESSNIIEKFLINFKVKFKKFYILMH